MKKESLSPIPIIFSKRFLEHDTGPGHPESPVRLLQVLNDLYCGSLKDFLMIIEPTPCNYKYLQWIHEQDYLFRFEEKVLKGHSFLDHPDNAISLATYECALLSAGSGITAINIVEREKDKFALPFCLIRPPGHHADPKHAYGFCFLNNVAISARYWQREFGRKRILIFDFDAHHGNGIQDVFYEEKDIFYISIHEDPLFSFPGTGFPDECGKGEGLGANLNIVFKKGGTEEEVIEVIDKKINPCVEKFKPDAIIIAAGFDAHIMDDMSGLQFTTYTYSIIGNYIRDWSNRYCHKRIISLLEGGYNLKVLGKSIENYLKALTLS